MKIQESIVTFFLIILLNLSSISKYQVWAIETEEQGAFHLNSDAYPRRKDTYLPPLTILPKKRATSHLIPKKNDRNLGLTMKNIDGVFGFPETKNANDLIKRNSNDDLINEEYEDVIFAGIALWILQFWIILVIINPLFAFVVLFAWIYIIFVTQFILTPRPTEAPTKKPTPTPTLAPSISMTPTISFSSIPTSFPTNSSAPSAV